MKNSIRHHTASADNHRSNLLIVIQINSFCSALQQHCKRNKFTTKWRKNRKPSSSISSNHRIKSSSMSSKSSLASKNSKKSSTTTTYKIFLKNCRFTEAKPLKIRRIRILIVRRSHDLMTAHWINRVTAGSGFGQMSDPRTVLRSSRPVNHVQRIEQIRIVRPVEQS